MWMELAAENSGMTWKYMKISGEDKTMLESNPWS